jgi:peptidoglycan hydrolase FlgJ
MMDNAGTQMGTEMLDTQFANKMTGLKGGLGDAIIRQLERQMGGADAGKGASGKVGKMAALAPAGAAGSAASTGSVSQRQSDFVASHTEAAQAAEAQTGIPATFMIAQAAHETGWGKRDIRNADGSASHNVFGIKAGSNWTGATTDVTTTEYVNGQAHRVVQKFRSYGSDAEAFADYAKLMKDSPRYANVVAAASNKAASTTTAASHFAQNLQKAGYATDPAYADKLTKMINTTLRVQRSMA